MSHWQGNLGDKYVEPDEDEHQTVTTLLKKTHARDELTLCFLYNAVDESRFKKIMNVASTKEA